MMKDPIDAQIEIYAKNMKIPTVANYRDVVKKMGPGATFGEVLLELLKEAQDTRHDNSCRRRIMRAGFPFLKTIEEFDMSQLNESVSPMFINELATCDFIKSRTNIIMLGNPGRGKTHLAIALGIKACYAGYNVKFRNAAELSTELCEARDMHMLGRMQRALNNADLLILDELGYITFNRTQSELLFKILADRSERKSTIVTSNLSFSQWPQLFEDNIMVNAMIDRLTFKSHVLDMNGESYRMRDTRKRFETNVGEPSWGGRNMG